VDPEGGKYEITTSSGGAEPRLMAWSGDASEALFGSGGTSTAAGGTGSYSLLEVRRGQLTALQLPAGVAAIGFTRPNGLAILAVRQGPGQFRLQRYTLTGQLQASLASLPRKQGASWPSDGCGSACALSSPDGTFDVWGIAGDEMEVLSNGGRGKPVKVHVPGGGHRSSCIPLSWWDGSTILAYCAAADLPADAAQLWLVPASGSQPNALTPAAAAGNGQIEGAWLAGQTTYVTSLTSRQCSGVTNGAGGLAIERLGQGSSGTVTIPGSTGNVSTVVASLGERLLVLAQTSCPGTSSLLWFNPSAGTAQLAWTVPANEVGVTAAVPFGNGPTAVASGQRSSG
jgi:TolB protein